MKLLILTNLYPPQELEGTEITAISLGGYGQGHQRHVPAVIHHI